jgi:hypothetical protein
MKIQFRLKKLKSFNPMTQELYQFLRLTKIQRRNKQSRMKNRYPEPEVSSERALWRPGSGKSWNDEKACRGNPRDMLAAKDEKIPPVVRLKNTNPSPGCEQAKPILKPECLHGTHTHWDKNQ